MFKVRSMFVFALFLFFMLGVIGGVAAQDATPESTPVSVLPPVVTDTPPVVVTPVPESPFTPTVIMSIIVIGGLIAVIIAKEPTTRLALVQLGASAPAFGYAGVKTGALEGITSLEGIAAKTDSKLDDAAVAEIKQIFADLFAEIDAKRSEQLKQAVASAMSDALNHASPVG